MSVKQIVLDFDGPLFDGRTATQLAISATIAHFKDIYPAPEFALKTLPLWEPNRIVAVLYPNLACEDRAEISSFYSDKLYSLERQLGVPAQLKNHLDALIKLGCELALFSGRHADNLLPLVKDLGLSNYFSADHIGCAPQYRKPSPDFLLKLRHPTDSIESIVFIGDSDLDYEAAKGAGVPYYHAGWSQEPTSESAANAQLVLRSFVDLVGLAADSLTYTHSPNNKSLLLNSVSPESLVFYGGAGISIPSHLGNWDDHYRPLLDAVSAGYLSSEHDLPTLLQMLCSRPPRAKDIFDRFRESFKNAVHQPNSYHYSMLRSGVRHVWTSNYDDLFEKAVHVGHFDHTVIRSNEELLNAFAGPLILKMNGDFEAGRYKDNLEWNMVFLQEQFDRAEHQSPELWRLFEDDYRHQSIVFVGVSFRDPVLRRILSVARAKITRTRRSHYLVTRREYEPAARVEQVMFAEMLNHNSIQTIFTETHTETVELIRQVALAVYRPIVGICGDAGTSEHADRDLQLADFRVTPNGLSEICAAIGQELARRQIRVTSGCAPFVGIPAVDAAFQIAPGSARYYIRKGGGTMYSRCAPAVVSDDDTYVSMRARFIPELSALIAIGGGQGEINGSSGTLEEIRMAIRRNIPVLLFPSAGGHVKREFDRLQQEIDAAYGDEYLRRAIRQFNDVANTIAPKDIVAFVRQSLPKHIEEVLRLFIGAATHVDRPKSALEW
jgi:phosphoglycolate phosphatase-like HAD superfamily hydrolase